MKRYAVAELGPSSGETKDFLLPFDMWFWLRFPVIFFFVGGSFPGSRRWAELVETLVWRTKR